MEKINALSIDLEEWYHSELVEEKDLLSPRRRNQPNPYLTFWIDINESHLFCCRGGSGTKSSAHSVHLRKRA